MAIEAWLMQENGDDKKTPTSQEPAEYVLLDELADVGVLYWNLDPNKYENDPDLNKIRQERGYSYMDLLELCPEKVEKEAKEFYTEHIHSDEEIRYCLEGSGYFDVRDKDDRWIRIHINAGDLIVLPAWIYHRFTLDNTNYIKLMRLFNRLQENHPAKKEYIKATMHTTSCLLRAL